MIAVDTSALLAILFDEPQRDLFRQILESSGKACVSMVSAVEAHMIMFNRRGSRGIIVLEDFLNSPEFELVSPGIRDIEIAQNAFIAYGKGSGHPAQLNFGDLFSYALAKARGLPLLYKGNDFSLTDIVAAVPLQ